MTFFFFNDTATTEIYTLSLHDALPIWVGRSAALLLSRTRSEHNAPCGPMGRQTRSRIVAPSCFYPTRDRKSTRLNSSHANISYAVFCLKKKNIVIPLIF